MASGGPETILFLLGHRFGLNHWPWSGEGPRLRPFTGLGEHQERSHSVPCCAMPCHATVALAGSGLAVQRAGMGQWAWPLR